MAYRLRSMRKITVLFLKKTVFILFLGMFSGGVWAEPAPVVEISPPEWKYGMIEQGDIAKTRVEARNRTDKRLRVSFVSTCD